MSWTEIPGEMLTNLPVAAVIGRNEELFVFAVGTDQRIYFNHRTAAGWASWAPTHEAGQTKVAVVAFAQPGGTVVMVHTGLNNKLYQTWWDGDSWAPWEPFLGGAGSTTMTMAVAHDERQYYWFHTGGNKKVYLDEVEYKLAL